MAGGGDLGFYIGSYTSDANATAFLTGRGYTQARGYLYWDSVTSQLKVWDGSAWGVVTGAGAVSPWTESPAGMIYPIDYSTDDVAVGTNAMAGTERFRVVGNTLFSGQVGVNQPTIASQSYVHILDDDETATKVAVYAVLKKDAASTKAAYSGLVSAADVEAGSGSVVRHVQAVTSTGGGSLDEVSDCYSSIYVANGDTVTSYYGHRTVENINGTVTTKRGVYLGDAIGSGAITTAYGIDIEDQGLSSTTTYGIRIKDQSGTATYGIYQEGADDVNVFMGQVGVNKAAPASASYVEVLDDDETNLRIAFNASLQKNAAGAKSGYVGFRTTADLLDGSSSLYGFQSFAVVNGGDSSSSTGFFSSLSVASGDTVTTSWGLHLEDVTGAGTITTAYGIEIEDQGLSSTTTYGIYIGDQSGTTAYGIYQAGTDDKNVFMGQVGINQTTFAGTNYVEVLDNEETSTRYAFVATLEKNAAGAKATYVGFSSGGSIDAGSVSSVRHYQAVTTTSGGDVTTSATGFYSGLVAGSGDTVTLSYGFWADGPVGSGTITTSYGIRIDDQGLSSTTTYGIYIEDQSGTTAYGVYQAGLSDFNFLNGTTGVGENPTIFTDPEFAKLYVYKVETSDLPSATKAGLKIFLAYDASATGYTLGEARAIDIDISNKSTDDERDILSAYGVYVNSPTGAGGDIRVATAFYCEDMTADSDVLAGWGIYLNGSTTRNYMAGVLGAKKTTPNNSYAIDAGDDINISTTHGLLVNDIQVVGDQQSAISDLTVTGSDQDSIARQGVNDILSALRAHGLIAT